jgi:single-strand DNA-binding protein
MRSVNKVILIGNLTRDPEMKATQSGQSVVTFGIATNREWMTQGSDRKKSTEFHEVVAWARLAELCHQYLRKGKLVYLEGYLKTRSWDAEGGKRFRTEIVLQDMIMLEKRSSGDDYADAEIAAAAQTPEAEAPAITPEIEGDNLF